MRKAFGSVWTVGMGQKTTQYCMNTSSPNMLNIRDTSVTFALSFAPHETLSEITNHPDIEKSVKELSCYQTNESVHIIVLNFMKMNKVSCSDILIVSSLQFSSSILYILYLLRQGSWRARWSNTRPWSCPGSWPWVRGAGSAAWSASTPAPWRVTWGTTWSRGIWTSATTARCATRRRSPTRPGTLTQKHISLECRLQLLLSLTNLFSA